MNPLERLVTALAAKTPLIQLCGRPLHDIEPQNQELVTLRELFRQHLQDLDIVLFTASLGEGVRVVLDGLPPASARAATEVLRRHNLTSHASLTTTIPSIVALLSDAPRATTRFVVLVLHAERCVGRVHDPALLPEEQLRMRELIVGIGTALPPRRYGNALILAADRGTLDPAIERAAVLITLPFPDATEKERMFAVAAARYPQAAFADNLTLEGAARLTAGTPHLDTEAALRHAHCTQRPISAAELFTVKQEAVHRHSEGVLHLAALRRQRLVGAYLEPARQELTLLCAGLARGDPDTEAMVVVHGPPGVGKTCLVQTVAAAAGIPVYELRSIEDKYVGESQRKSTNFHQLRMQPEYVPNLILADELNHITTHRDAHDGGVSQALCNDWLTSTADPNCRGRSLIAATTNVPHRLPAAFQSRCSFIPVFAPSHDDLATIIAHLCQEAGFNPIAASDLSEAAGMLYSKGASPRDVARMVRRLRRRHGTATSKDILAAADDVLVSDTAWQATVYCDYRSLQTMTGKAAFPWRDRAAMPAHLAAVIDEHGTIDYEHVRARLQELGDVRV
ncbi:MAG TPA: ATP-binding protein [Thermoanaerobaculales bacterium]|nr:ATP-binding protein [Thermoanaerobaculales bacterium]HPA83123.1 ATP-binding protein [Thermoanaerobaculales bacterium]HQP35677.1 ATP-binding protein [Polyangiaceae bacterium]